MSEFLEIDGSVLEGGGQILRMSISLSAILGVPVRVSKIRANRSKPGLAAQHCTGIKLVAEMCHAKLKGAEIGSTEVEFNPGKIKGGHYIADTKTAGSICLLLQVALPCALLADGPVTLDLKGGTNADMAPQLDYMDLILKPALQKFKADYAMVIHRRGYFPKGGGHVIVDIRPVRKLEPIPASPAGSLTRIYGYSFVSGRLPVKMAYQMSDGAKRQLADVCDKIDIRCHKDNNSTDNCNGIILSATLSNGWILGSDGLGKRGVDAYEVGRKAGEDLRRSIDAGVSLDPHLQDQLILYMALADGKSVVTVDGEITLHTKTAIYIAEKIAKTKFEITNHGEKSEISCDGIGFINKNMPPE